MSAIGVFDSGVGGLTVLKALKARWPFEDFIYLADTARLPYGTKSLHTIHHYVEQNLAYLSRFDLKAVVVACNSASTAILEQPIACKVPLFNVIRPGARRALQVSESKNVGVIGTRATVHGEAYLKEIRKLDAAASVHQQACPLLVPLVEEGWLDDPLTNMIVYRYLTPLLQHKIDTLILGCTHYPALVSAIRRVTGLTVNLVDSSEGLIEDLQAVIPEDTLSHGRPPGRLHILCTDFSPRLEETIRLLLNPLVFDAVETVDL